MATVLMLGGTPQLAWAAEHNLLLDVVVNGYPIGEIGDFVMREGILLSTRNELRDLGFRVPGNLSPEAGDLIDLRRLQGVTLHLDEAGQTLMITATDGALLPTLLAVNTAPGRNVAMESGTGATLNYDLNANASKGRNGASGLLDVRAFSPKGVLKSGMLVYAGEGQRNPGTASVIRLDSSYTFSDTSSLRRYRMGDFITGGLTWTRPVRLGGAQFTSDFSMRPDLVTFPLPSLNGSAAVPSTVDVLVNGNRLLSREVRAGPFEIAQLPVVTGAGTVALTVTNALGRQVVTTLPFYASADLLAPGLQTFSAQAGAVRRNWGQVSNDYGPGAASATWRRGLSPNLTVEGSAETTAGTFMAGAGAVMNVGNLAVLNVAAAGSSGAANRGTRLSTGVQRVSTRFSFGTSLAVAGKYFRDIAAINGDPVPRFQFSASGGMSLGALGSLGMSYTRVKRDSAVTSFTLLGGITDAGRLQTARVLSASYSIQFRGVSLYATTFRDFDRSGSSGVSIGLTLPLGPRSSVSASMGNNAGSAYRQVQAQQSAVSVGDWGYQAFAADGAAAHQFAQVQYKAPWALMSAGVDRSGNDTTLSLQSQGALSFIDGGVFTSNIINDSFALVTTDGLAGVHVLHENRIAGITDAKGRLLIPDLRGFDVNYLAIDPTDIPPDATLNIATREVRLPDKSGIVLRFAVSISHGALIYLHDAAGDAIPVGSSATLQATGVSVPVGYDGQAYVEGLAAHNQLTIVRADGKRCLAGFDYEAIPGNIPTLGPLTCQDMKP
ncbi:MAG: fimbrial biogenesis outer membrane usher protein [Polaromonas sp.]|nr:fimbrial biogenesis outer membrane usher protein [Polaromonas sp.]